MGILSNEEVLGIIGEINISRVGCLVLNGIRVLYACDYMNITVYGTKCIAYLL